MYKKTDKPGVYRDTATGALINKNDGKISAYKKQKKFMSDVRELKNNYDNLVLKLNSLEKEIEYLREKVK